MTSQAYKSISALDFLPGEPEGVVLIGPERGFKAAARHPIDSVVVAREVDGRSDVVLVAVVRHAGCAVVPRRVRALSPAVDPLGDRVDVLGLPPRALGAEGVRAAGKDPIAGAHEDLKERQTTIELNLQRLHCFLQFEHFMKFEVF